MIADVLWLLHPFGGLNVYLYSVALLGTTQEEAAPLSRLLAFLTAILLLLYVIAVGHDLFFVLASPASRPENHVVGSRSTTQLWSIWVISVWCFVQICGLGFWGIQLEKGKKASSPSQRWREHAIGHPALGLISGVSAAIIAAVTLAGSLAIELNNRHEEGPVTTAISQLDNKLDVIASAVQGESHVLGAMGQDVQALPKRIHELLASSCPPAPVGPSGKPRIRRH